MTTTTPFHAEIEFLVALSDPATHAAWLEDFARRADPATALAFADALKTHADHARATTALDRSFLLIHLLYTFADITHNPLYRALGLRAEGNTRLIGLGEFAAAIRCYDEAASIYDAAAQPEEAAGAQVAKVWALAMVQRYPEIAEIERTVPAVLAKYNRWLPLANLYLNLGAVYGRIGEDEKALSLLDRAKTIYEQLGNDAAPPSIAMVENSRAIHLRNLGRFDEAIRASELACTRLHDLRLDAEAANAEQTLAVTYYVLGRYTQALDLFDRARTLFAAEQRWHQTLVVDISVCECLLQLRRFHEVLTRCAEIRTLVATIPQDATGTPMRLEVAQALLVEAVAYAGLHRYDNALASLVEVRRRFEAEGSPVWVAITDLERARLLGLQEKWNTSRTIALNTFTVFDDHHLPLRAAEARLMVAWAATQEGNVTEGIRLVQEALAIAEARTIPALAYQFQTLLGRLARTQQDLVTARVAYEQAISELEQWRGAVMIAYRADFVADKAQVYEEMTVVLLQQGDTTAAFETAERSKSRALLDMLAYRLDLSLDARQPGDQALVEEIRQRRQEHDHLYRQWESRRAAAGHDGSAQGDYPPMEPEWQAHEQRITELWHTLLIRNAGYARDVALWQVHTEPLQTVQALLPDGTTLLEYVVVEGQLGLFCITRATLTWHPLGVAVGAVEPAFRLWHLNLATVAHSTPDRMVILADNARRGALSRFYRLLLAPIEAVLAHTAHLIVVPHALLHYLPFHAFYDGTRYLLEKVGVSYLPAASVLPYSQTPSTLSSSVTTFGYSSHGALPRRVEEATAVANMLGGTAYVEDAATRDAFTHHAPLAHTLHVATHGFFQRDNPLFSGLTLADGYLTTMDIFGLRLDADLVTLSACETKQSQLAGGDELIGLSQAFLHAGARSLLLTQWAVEDDTTSRLMQTFYHHLRQGQSKAEALRQAQMTLIRGTAAEHTPAYWQHPFFWAAFFLVGNW